MIAQLDLFAPPAPTTPHAASIQRSVESAGGFHCNACSFFIVDPGPKRICDTCRAVGALASQQLLKLCPVLSLYWSSTRLDFPVAGQEDQTRTLVYRGGDQRCQLEVKGERCVYGRGHSPKCSNKAPRW